MATAKQVRAIRGAAYDLVSAAVRQAEAEHANADFKTVTRLANKVKAHRARFEEALSALAGKEKSDDE